MFLRKHFCKCAELQESNDDLKDRLTLAKHRLNDQEVFYAECRAKLKNAQIKLELYAELMKALRINVKL